MGYNTVENAAIITVPDALQTYNHQTLTCPDPTSGTVVIANVGLLRKTRILLGDAQLACIGIARIVKSLL